MQASKTQTVEQLFKQLAHFQTKCTAQKEKRLMISLFSYNMARRDLS